MRTSLLILIIITSKVSYTQFKLKDTLFFLRDSNQFYYHRIFVDTNKKSEFYSYVSDFSFKKFDASTYKNSLDYLYAKKLYPEKQSYFDFPDEWTKLEIYKGILYVYSPADYYSHYKIKLTDSVFINWNGEGPEAAFIKKFQQLDSITYKFILTSQTFKHREITIKFINKRKGIAIFHDKRYDPNSNKISNYYFMMVTVKEMRKIPLLINTCDNQKQEELEFDKVDYRTMFKKNATH